MNVCYRKGEEERLLKIRKKAIKLMKKHGLMKGDNPWQFTFNYAKTILGQCDYEEREIQLSKYWMLSISYNDAVQTILHEIAHALTPGHNHDSVWVAKCIEIGGDGNRLYEGKFQRKHKELNYTYPDLERYRIAS